jgi:hypothetical protein
LHFKAFGLIDGGVIVGLHCGVGVLIVVVNLKNWEWKLNYLV